MKRTPWSLPVNRLAGVCMLLAGLVHAAENPISVTSLSGDEKPFREPIIEVAEPIEQQYEIQLLRQEVQDLRGLVEELSHELGQLKTRQADRYLELDRRIEDLRKGGPASVARDTPSASAATTSETPVGVEASAGEKQTYDMALELMRNRQWDQAVAQLERLISEYPNGEFAPNAYYWLGEVHAAKPEPDYEKARQALAQVISYFPDNHKVPDAAFKLGKVYHLMGDCARARDILTQVVQQNQGHSVARLAESYLRDKVGTCP